RKSALTYKMKDQQITLVEDFCLEKPQTKQYVEILNNLNVHDQKTLLVVNQYDRNLYLSLRNVQNAGMIVAADLNTYEVLKAHKLLITESSVATIDGILNHNTKTKTQ
ncbi:MAG: uL4 family ribosomal protein, partial [Bacteroidales bacterium]